MASSLLPEVWLPKSVLCLRDYSVSKFLRDLVAGITVGLVALPLAMAFAIASGLTPQAGIYCAITGIFAGFAVAEKLRSWVAQRFTAAVSPLF